MRLGDPINSYAYLKGLFFWKRSVQETQLLAELYDCDLVHLNSSVLLPSAFSLHRARRRFVWHVREAAQPKYFGNRLRLWRRALAKFPSERVFLSESDRTAWMGDDRLGVVVPHGVSEPWFDVPATDALARKVFSVPADEKVLLYVGGFMRIKGIFTLLQALRMLKSEGVTFLCLMPELAAYEVQAGDLAWGELS